MGTRYKGTPEEIDALNAFIKLTRATESVISRILQEVPTDNNLTLSQFGTLEALYHLGPLCLGEIGEKILKSSGNMTTVVDNLEKRGLVRRERDQEDRRQILVHLTKEGESLISTIFPMHVDVITQEMTLLTSEELQELGRLCKILGTQNRDA